MPSISPVNGPRIASNPSGANLPPKQKQALYGALNEPLKFFEFHLLKTAINFALQFNSETN